MSRKSLKRRLLRRPSPALVVSMIALVVASAGVANGGIGGSKLAPTAAAGPFITGAHVLDGSLTGADINQATLTAVANAAHANGADFATNAGHATSADSASSATNAGNANTLGGIAPSGYFRTSGDLPAGVTLRGNYAVGGQLSGANGFGWEGVSYLFPMRVAPTPHFIPSGTTPPAGCPGSATNPQASPGNLCVYEDFSSLVSAVHIFKPEVGGTDQAGKWGFGLWFISNNAGNGFSYGSWAATSS